MDFYEIDLTITVENLGEVSELGVDHFCKDLHDLGAKEVISRVKSHLRVKCYISLEDKLLIKFLEWLIKNQRVHKGKLIFHAIGYEPVRATAFLWVGMHQIDDISNVCFVTTEMLQRNLEPADFFEATAMAWKFNKEYFMSAVKNYIHELFFGEKPDPGIVQKIPF